MCSCSCRTPRSGTARHPVWTKRKVLAASRSSGRPAGCSYEGPSSQLRSCSTAGSAFWSGVPERVLQCGSEAVPEWVLERFRRGFWRGSGEQVPERVSGVGSGAFPQRLQKRFRSGFPARSDQNHCAKPCKMHGNPKDKGIQCPMPYAVLAQGLLWCCHNIRLLSAVGASVGLLLFLRVTWFRCMVSITVL